MSTIAFTRRDALARGFTVNDLAGSQVRRIFHDRYIDARQVLTVRVRAEAALRDAAPGTRLSHHTAAVLHGGWAPLTLQTHLSVPGEVHRTRRRGISAHRAAATNRTVMRRGLPMSAACDLLLELARVGVGLIELVMVGDSLLKAKATTVAELEAAAEEWTGAGVRAARRAVALVRDGVDSIMESRLRLLLVLAGLPEPEVNRVIRHPDGSWRWRFDLSLPEYRLIIEYDGRQHAENSRQWNIDLRRREELEAAGWRIIVVTAEAMFGAPVEVVERVRQGMIAGGARQRRRQPSAEWRRLFEPATTASD